MAYQDIPTGATPGAGAGSGQVSTSGADTTGGFLGSELTTTPADITKAVVGGGGNETLNLSLPNLGPGAATTGTTDAPVKSITTDHAGRISAIGTWATNTAPASWATTITRYFLVDYDGGNDANVGYVDAAAGSTIAPAGLAKKTINSGLMNILPRNGNGRSVVILVKNRAAGATYLDDDAVTASAVDFSACYGYAAVGVRGSSDLTNSVTDRLLCGGVVGYAGPNGDSSWTSAAGATVKQLTVAAGTLPAEPASNAGLTTYAIGMRVRFSGNVTAGIANINTACWRNGAGTSTIEFGQDVATAPANGDTFFLERPGVRFDTFKDFNCGTLGAVGSSSAFTSARGFTVGIACVNATASPAFLFGTAPGPMHQYAFVEADGGWVSNRPGCRIQLAPSYNDETGTLRAVGVGLRAKPFLFFTGGTVISSATPTMAPAGLAIITRGLFVTTGLAVTDIPRLQIAGGNYIGDGIACLSPGTSNGAAIGNQGSSTAAKLRIVRASSTIGLGAAGLAMAGTVTVNGVEFQDCTTGPCLLVASFGQAANILLDNCVAAAAGGNTQYGMSIIAIYGARVRAATTVTVTGTLGDIRFATDSVITSWASLTLTNVIDRFGANVVGTAGEVIGQPGVLVTNKEGAALAVGNVVRGNGTASQVVKAFATTEPNCRMLGVMTTATADNTAGYMVCAGAPYVLFDAAPTVDGLTYLSVTTAGTLTKTSPPLAATNQKQRNGRVISASASTGRIPWHPESVCVTADGLA